MELNTKMYKTDHLIWQGRFLVLPMKLSTTNFQMLYKFAENFEDPFAKCSQWHLFFTHPSYKLRVI